MGKYGSTLALSISLAVLSGALLSGAVAKAQSVPSTSSAAAAAAAARARTQTAPATSAPSPSISTQSQAGAVAAQAQSGGTQPGAGPVESLPIGPGDTVHVTFFDEPNLEQRVRVDDAGNISLSLIGSIHVVGLTPSAAAQAIAARYKQGGFLNNPQVQVFVEQYATENVSVLGQVRLPGPVPSPTPRSILDVLALAGGLTDLADRNVTIQRTNGERIKVFISNFSDVALEASKIIVYPGDIVLVPKAGIVYVLGNVFKPGGYVMQDESKITVLQAIAAAGGTATTAGEGGAKLLRHESSGVAVENIHLNAMQKGKQPDVLMQNDDIVWVPFSFWRNIEISTPGILSSAASASIYQLGR